MASNQITIDRRSIERTVRGDDFIEIWLAFRTRDCSREDLVHALNIADEKLDLISAGPAITPDGFSFGLSTSTEGLQSWLTHLVEELAAVGVSGRIQAAKEAHVDMWPTDDATPAGFLAWSLQISPDLTAVERQSHWQVEPAATEAITQHAAGWTAGGGDHSIVNLGLFSIALAPEADVSPIMEASLARNQNTACIRYRPEERSGRTAYLSSRGEGILQVIGASVPWQHRVDATRTGLLTCPTEYLDLAFIRPATPRAQFWSSIDMRQELPDLLERNIRYNRHLLSHYTPDAHGIQILTDQHLTRARDLSAWNIQKLDHGRYLVEAEDTTPWYSTPLPDQDTVDQARHDFGDMILTKVTIATNPPPWKPAA